MEAWASMTTNEEGDGKERKTGGRIFIRVGWVRSKTATMADIPCLACGKIVRGDRGLSMHTKRWCPYKKSADDSLLCEYKEQMAAKEVELERLQHLQEEEEAEQRRVEQEREALHMQRLTEFTNKWFAV